MFGISCCVITLLVPCIQDRSDNDETRRMASQRLFRAYVNTFGQELDAELLVAGRFAAQPIPVERIARTFRSRVRDAAKTASRTRELYTAYRPALPSDLSVALTDALREYLTEDEFDRYRRDLKLRREFALEASVLACLVYLDETLAFSDDQRRKMETYLRERWELGTIPVAYATRSVGFRLKGEPFKRILSEAQLVEWSKQGPNGLMMSSSRDAGKLRERLEAAVVLRNGWLEAAVSLTAAQKRRLGIACKGAIQYVVADQVAVYKLFSDTVKRGGNASDVPLKTFNMERSTPGDALLSDSKWQALSRTILTAAQQAEFDRLFAERRQRVHSATCYLRLSGYAQTQKLSGQQVLGLYKLFLKRIKPEPTPRRIPSVQFLRQMTNIPEAEYKAVLGDKWPGVKAILEGTRKRLLGPSEEAK